MRTRSEFAARALLAVAVGQLLLELDSVKRIISVPSVGKRVLLLF
jgi:hypothetical protein